MKAIIEHNHKFIKIDLLKPLDISIPLRASKSNVNAWYIGAPVIEPVKTKDWTGSVKAGADVNFNNIQFNPHAHGTHTECIGHITEEFHSINKNLTQFFFTAELISVAPEKFMKDTVISKHQIELLLKDKTPEALVIRTMPNTKDKKSRQYSETNWTYVTEEAMVFLREKGIQHFLIDLPSVDREHDGGKLLSHKAFWDFDGDRRMHCTITEFIYVNNKIIDGSYMLNLQIAPFENDASPSKPVLYKIFE
ncbi:kynurenine formamidase [Gelidibacter algens]|uniref:Kynurenine formamidase n=1 Tax=Gelidibacter algens TaxID=49280 RepID=A0A1A7R0I6_9FLAO|nr:cyclase family protein [Gelidibacter algens]OBX24999.1 metal-dependent hydrolase [Gelidibacter algens]RAJ19850.1 kynurenine formamidase [Gelidibacter algens]